MRAVVISCIVAIASSGCIMPQHRGVASVVNGAVVASSIAMLLAVEKDEANPNSWHVLDEQTNEVSAGVLVLGILGELLTLGLHEDPPPVVAPSIRPSTERGSSALTTLRLSVP